MGNKPAKEWTVKELNSSPLQAAGLSNGVNSGQLPVIGYQ